MVTRILKQVCLSCLAVLTMAGSGYTQQTRLSVQDLIGTYKYSGGFAGGSITIEAEGRYHTNSSDCTQEYFDAGTYTFKDGVISFVTMKSTVKSHGENDNQARNLLDPKVYKEIYHQEPTANNRTSTLIPVKWGDRLYLIESHSLREFCNAINLGLEPRRTTGVDSYLGVFYLRDGDHEKSTLGHPNLSKELIDLFLVKPIEAKVINIELTDGMKLAAIDKGSNAGLKPGMRLVLAENGFGDGPSLWSGLVVVSVTSDLAKLKLFEEAKVGDKVTSKFVDRRFQ